MVKVELKKDKFTSLKASNNWCILCISVVYSNWLYLSHYLCRTLAHQPAKATLNFQRTLHILGNASNTLTTTTVDEQKLEHGPKKSPCKKKAHTHMLQQYFEQEKPATSM